MKIFNFILLSTILLALSCFDDDDNFQPDNCLDGLGVTVSETRTLGDFHSIMSTVYADIVITQDTQEEVIIEAQQNIINELNTEVVNGELRISHERCVDILQAIKIYITIPDINSITLTGVGDVIAQNEFTLDDLNVTLTGVGDFMLQGTTSTLDITLSGVGNVNAFDLNADSCNVVISGTGDVEVFVNDELDVTISGSGTVFYKGNPSINSTITGIGSIVDAN